MKQLFWAVSIMLTAGASFAQSDPDLENLKKYWKLRNDFREDFVKISDEPGGGQAARRFRPLDCYNNATPSDPLGTIHYGDGTIRHGYYLGLLATEYRMFKDAGLDVTGTLNELYYALVAFNRLDRKAEFDLAPIYGTTEPEKLNGFFKREDIPGSFASENWLNSSLRAACVDSPNFETNNVNGENAKINSYQNVPSNDQLSSLMVGFRLIHKLVDVNATPAVDPNFHVVAETQAIVNRIMTFLTEHNWMMIDVNGWPVTNGGGDVLFNIYPLFKAAKIITGIDYTTEWDRKIGSLYINPVQTCITGFGKDSNEPEYVDEMCELVHNEESGLIEFEIGKWQFDFLPGVANPAFIFIYNQLEDGVPAGPDNNQDHSEFQHWLADKGAFSFTGDHTFLSDFWTQLGNHFSDYEDDHKLGYLPLPYSNITWNLGDRSGTDDNNEKTIIGNYGVASGLWDGLAVKHLTQSTGDHELDLVNAILRGETPPLDQAFYKQFMDQMPYTGPYYFERRENPQDAEVGENMVVRGGAGPYWSSQHRWTFTSQLDGQSGNEGIFNGLDYMMYHNLYRIAFKNSTSIVNREAGDECLCGSAPQIEILNPKNNAQQAQWVNEVTSRLQHVNYCTENVFQPVLNLVSGTFDVQPYFPHYVDLNIVTTEFETANAVIEGTGTVNTKTRFVICNNSVLTIEQNGKLNIGVNHTLVNSGSVIDADGTITVKDGTKLIIKEGATLILRDNAKLVIEDHAEVVIERGGKLIYNNGSQIVTLGDGSYLTMRGTLQVESNATFTLDHSAAPSQSGLLVFEKTVTAQGVTVQPQIVAAAGAKFVFNSKGTWDPIIAVKPGTIVRFGDTDIESIHFQNCAVIIDGEGGAGLRFEQPITTSLMVFKGSASSAGHIWVTDQNSFFRTDFVDMNISGEMHLENKRLNLTRCNFTQTDPVVNIGAGVHVHGYSYRIRYCNFNINAGGLAMVESEELTMNSEIANSKFGSTNNAVGDLAVYDVSDVQIRIASCEFNHLDQCIFKSTNTLLLRCNTFSNSFRNDIVADHVTIEMRISQGGGYNTFGTLQSTASSRTHVSMKNCLINMTDGSNYMIDVPVNGGLIRGSLMNSAKPNLSGNQWRNFPFVLSGPQATSRINLVNNEGAPIGYDLFTANQKSNCGQLDGITTVLGGVSSTASGAIGQLPTYFSQIIGRDLRVDEGIKEAMNVISALNDDEIGNDILAVELLNEIFTGNVPQTNTTVQKLLTVALDQMKVALSGAINSGAITVEENQSELEPHVAMYANALNKMTAATVTTANYHVQFINEINKAHLFRMIGQPNKAMQVLNHAESCNINSPQQVILNRQKIAALRSISVKNLGDAALDTVIVVDSSSFMTPLPYNGPYKFGAKINSLDNITYPSCTGSKSMLISDEDEAEFPNDISVYPNPATEEVNVELQHDAMSGNSTLTFFQMDGRIIQTMEFSSAENPIVRLDVSQWISGTYQYKYTRPDGVETIGKLVIQ